MSPNSLFKKVLEILEMPVALALAATSAFEAAVMFPPPSLTLGALLRLATFDPPKSSSLLLLAQQFFFRRSTVKSPSEAIKHPLLEFSRSPPEAVSAFLSAKAVSYFSHQALIQRAC